MKNINPTTTKAWKELEDHYKEIKNEHMKDMFNNDEKRSEKFTIQWEDFYVDYSKNRITEDTRALLLQLAEECHLKDAINSYFGGEAINQTENRPVLHTALRANKDADIKVSNKNVVPEVQEVKAKIRDFSNDIIDGTQKGYTGKAFTDIVNIGIGGSDLGPVMVTESLEFYKNHLKVHFISNVDGDHVHETIKDLNPETTLFLIVSKTFTTMETLSNATTVREWFLKSAPQKEVSKHFVAVSTNLQQVEDFGIDVKNIFPMWDWVGGRFSLWSAVGLSISLAIGYENFESLLDGARKMDDHFKETSFEENLPVQLALISIWYNNFFKAESEAVIPYSQYLDKFPSYLQQAIMESNGKSVDRNGEKVDYQTGTIIWGEPGTNSQHAFFQLIHQGTKLIPTDFIGFKHSLFEDKDHQDKLMANYFAQTEALLNGKTEQEVEGELKSKAFSQEEIDRIKAFKVFEGNNPTNTILIEKLTPESMGKLIALYEHKIFVQGVIWNIFSYDQWGVELGKQLANKILAEFSSKTTDNHDSSTKKLLKFYMS
ncbi:glucose-6-phosphate isomerase [Christiangramia forsetii]|uniref:Glucose-6-phosphate isomerase n=2 Tax=Christiangramia forsetii TaxID=411153 RepID=G6PI_CHRFK|nr:glucose-6-phosphate isomerase [Christiangramia forsetii]A0M665.1 RecName: Full=Glucose-6-phosphate isomerase; Short=GPI; AltName: Full=Phosphoglucose isomerase; Short=PGI; AltName: Full=Phosphohexose isomerase; Short=PHI [Christiangramia forsetii KT0803]GGG31265.1 glucose-6-phosphate isomerase [Christiangramia forsetii]CAL68110.1 glucose-6-phosphate isomerase [Christiangramia forsetii KT0803]